jgi:hypothetical protein
MKNCTPLWYWMLTVIFSVSMLVVPAQSTVSPSEDYPTQEQLYGVDLKREAERMLYLQRHQQALENEALLLQQLNNDENQESGFITLPEESQSMKEFVNGDEDLPESIITMLNEQSEVFEKAGITPESIITGKISSEDLNTFMEVIQNEDGGIENSDEMVAALKELIGQQLPNSTVIQGVTFNPETIYNGDKSIMVTLGTGTTVNTPTGVPTPYGTYYKNFRQQYLILASELTTLGVTADVMSSLAFNVQAVNNCVPMPNFTIKIKHTTANVLTTTFDNGTYTTVWSDPNFLPVVGWNTHYFSTPFSWDGIQNVLIDICSDIIPGDYTQNASVYYTETIGINTCLRYQSDATIACGTTLTGSLTAYRANMQMIFGPISCLPPGQLTVTNITTTSADLGWTPIGTETMWNIKYGVPGFNPATEGTLISGVTSNPYTLSGLIMLTQYDFYVQADCGSGDVSVWSGPKWFQTTSNPLSGNYTINSTLPTGGTNFINFFDFASALNLGGLSGPIVVDVVAGTGPYNEQVILGEINNSNPTNTIILNGNGETLEYLSTNTNERATLKMNGTDFMSINDLVIVALGSQTTPAEYGFAVHLMNGADNITFYNCEFIATKNSTSLNFTAFVTSNSATSATTAGLAVNKLKVMECTVVGGYYGMVINGPTVAPFSINNTIIGNEIVDFYLYGIYLRGQNATLVSENILSRAGRTTISTAYMIYLTNDMSGTEITKNRMFAFAPLAVTTSAAYGIYGTTVSADPVDQLLIANNVTSGYENMNGINYGIYLSTVAGLGNIILYHNSLSVDNVNHPGASAIYGMYFTGATAGLDMQNNIVSVTSNSTGAKYCLYFATNTALVTSNYNVLHMGASSNKNIGYWNAVAYPTLADWKTANGGIYDQNSVDVDPIYASPGSGNLTPGNPMVNNIGTDLTLIVPDDINGVMRSSTPDPGAYEFVPTNCIQPSGLNVALVTGTTADLDWTDNNSPSAISWDIELGLAGFTPTGVPTVAGITSKPYTYTGLTSSTAYHWYVKANCGPGDESPWVGPHSFTTACGSFLAPFFEPFQNQVIPYCWNMSGPQTWLFTTTWPGYGATGLQDHTGTGGSFAGVDGSGSVSLTGITLETPFIDVSVLTAPQLRFYIFNNNIDNADWQSLRVDLWNGTTWNNSVYLWGPTMNSPTWEEITVILTPYNITGDIQIRFVVEKSGGSPFYDDLIIDDVYVEEAPACPNPINLNAINLSEFTADLVWTSYSGLSDVEWGLTGFTPTGVPTNPGVTSPLALSGLTSLTNYDFYVRDVCTGGDYSNWVGPLTFQTTSAQLSGLYTINSTLPTGGTNFVSFTDFATAINSGGLAGPVTVDVVLGSGPYTEQVMLGILPNSSAVNTLTINGNGETLQFLSTNTNERGTLKFSGTDYVTVDNLVIKALGELTGEFGWAVWLTNNADFNTFNGCHFIATQNSTLTNFVAFVTSSSATGPTTAGFAASDLTVINCIAEGGYYGMVINGPTGTPNSENMVISKNQIKDFYLYGLYLRGNNNSIISENTISRPNRSSVSTAYLIYLSNYFSGTSIIKNKLIDFAVSATTTSTAYGLYGSALSADLGQELLIANNVISGFANMNGAQYGMYLSAAANLGNFRIYHNSVSLDHVAHTGASAIYGMYFLGASANLDIRNNIVSYTTNSTGTKYCLYFSANTAVVTSNYNVLHRGATAGTNHTGYWSTVAYTTLADWKGANGGIYDQNSVDADPLFASSAAGNLMPGNPLVNDIGTDLTAFVPDDINGIIRTITPDPGAYEFTPTGCVQPGNLNALNILGTQADLAWTENNVPPVTLWDIELGLSGFTPTGVPTAVGVSSNPYTYTGLSPSTAYQWYVRADCGSGNSSNWAGPHTFTTACATFTAPFVEHFQNTTIPNCWSMFGPQLWVFTTTWPGYGAMGLQDHTGTGGSFAGVDGSGSVNLTGITLVSPYIDVSTLINPQLRFYLFNNNIDNADWQTLRVDLWNGTTWNDSIYLWGPTDNNPNWVEVEVVLSPFNITGDIQLRFVVDKSAGSPFYDDLIIDDIFVEEASACPKPVNLGAVNITSTSADLTWSSISGLSDVEFGPGGFTPTGVPTHPSVVSPLTITGLASATFYSFYVRDNCGTGTFSNWAGPYTFATPCDVFNIPVIETFDAVTFPLCWTQTYEAGVPSDRWAVTTTNTAGGTPNEMRATWVSGTGISRLITPPLNLTGTVPSLKFKHFFDDYGAGLTMKLQTSSDGITWTDEAFSFVSGAGNVGPAEVEITLANNIGPTTYIAWVMDGNHFQLDFWTVDNVEVYQNLFGTLSGIVTEASTGNPVQGAMITAGPYSGTSGADGSYSFNALVGTYSASCTAAGYNAQSGISVTILDGITTTQNFSMTAPAFIVNPDAVNVVIQPGQTLDITVNLSNTGNGPGDWNAGLIEINTKGTKDLFDLQFQWPTAGSTGESGVATDGNFIYTSTWNSSNFHKYTMDGTYVGSFTVGPVSGIRDLTYDGTHFYGSAANTTVFEMDLANETLIGSFTAPTAVRALAYDEASDAFYANNLGTDIFKFNKSGANLGSFPVGPFGTDYYGFAVDNYSPGAPYLWGYARVGATMNQLVQIQLPAGTETGVTFNVGSIVSVGTGLAGGLTINKSVVPGLHVLTGIVQGQRVWGLELTEAGPDWLTLAPIGGTLAAGANQDIVLSFDAGSLAPGLYEAELHFNFMPAVGSQMIPVTMLIESTILPAPTGLVVGYDCTDATLTWDMPAGSTPDSWNVYRDGVMIGNVTSMTHDDPMMTPDMEYCYQITALYGADESDPTDPACITIPMPADIIPAALAGEANIPNGDNITLTWTAPTGCLTPDGYNVYRDDVMINTGLVTEPTFVDQLDEDGTYVYAVTAVYYFGESALSMTVSVYIEITGITQHYQGELLVFPNPASEYVQIQAEIELVRIILLDNSGKTVRTESALEKHHRLDVSQFERGIYYLRMETREGMAIRKITVR